MRAATGRLAPVDEAQLAIDHAGQVNEFLIAGLLSPGGFVGSDGGVDLTALRAELATRIFDVPALCRVPVPKGRRHRWAELSPRLDQHIRLTDPVSGLDGLERACAELMTVPLELNRPPWELLIVPGASAGQVGMVLRMHHVVADGVTALAIVERLFEPSGSGRHSSPKPTSVPSVSIHRKMRPLPSLGQGGLRLVRVLTMLGGRGTGPTMLLGDRSQHRGVIFVDTDLAGVQGHVHGLGATVNDALLASAAAGYRSALSSAGEHVPADLPVSVPVALRRRGASSNQVGVMRVRLPLAIPDSDARLEIIAARTRTEKVRAREQGTLEFMRGPWGARVMDHIGRRQHVVAGFVTNVAGPADQLCLVGAPVVAIWPVAGLAGNVRLGVTAVSYAGRLRCSVHFDTVAVPGAVFAHAMQEELTRLAG